MGAGGHRKACGDSGEGGRAFRCQEARPRRNHRRGNGKPLVEGIEEAEFAAEIFKYYADNGPNFAADQEIPTNSAGRAMIRRLPIGALLGVMPWNFPYYQVARFAGPNLMLGNTIILKHAEICPRSALAISQILNDAGLPQGVYNNVFTSHD